ncbi:uncharacterized protein LOC143042865 isoform X1 [Mytilus galloprovincialis]|uniref:uncharacterized protein LOC143042865 isoform X1 n=1 Tax=Mytilus galloprovincialis TaxID=29158 RepID=UPI003F7CCD9B
MERIRRSLRKKKKNKQKDDNNYRPETSGCVSTEVRVVVTGTEAQSRVSELKACAKKLKNKLKKDGSGKRSPVNDYRDEYSNLREQMEQVKQCFQCPDDDDHGRVDEDAGGFKRPRTNSPTHAATVHNNEREPIADYTYSESRNNERVDTSRVPFYRSHSVDDRKTRKLDYRMQEELKVREQANEKLQRDIQYYKDQLQQYKDDLRRSKRDLDTEIKAREEAQNRLSEMMGKQLKNNNPAITDLSDPDRPLSLVEKFSNVYDNEWTDTIEEIEQVTGNEKAATKILLTVVIETYLECYDLRHKGNCALELKNRSATVQIKVNEIADEYKIQLKKMKSNQLQSLKQGIMQKIAKNVDGKVLSCLSQSKKQYFEKCLELCWIMVCHSPPIHLDWEYKGHSFDLQILRPFTESGDVVDYIIWPVMFLHKDGPLLCKGVAQGRSSSSGHTQGRSRSDEHKRGRTGSQKNNQGQSSSNQHTQF